MTLLPRLSRVLPVTLLGARGPAWFPSGNMMGVVGGTIRGLLIAFVGASAALLGLVFVGLSINLREVLASPLAWYVTDLWLRQFANRTSFGVGIVAGCAAFLLAVALLTVASQTVRKARLDPARSLRYE